MTTKTKGCPNKRNTQQKCLLVSQKRRRTRLRVDRVKPWNSVSIKLGLGLRGPDIRPGFDNLIIESHRGLKK